MFLQLWHVGRVSHPLFLNGATPESASAVKQKGHVSLVRPETEYVTPRALEILRKAAVRIANLEDSLRVEHEQHK